MSVHTQAAPHTSRANFISLLSAPFHAHSAAELDNCFVTLGCNFPVCEALGHDCSEHLAPGSGGCAHAKSFAPPDSLSLGETHAASGVYPGSLARERKPSKDTRPIGCSCVVLMPNFHLCSHTQWHRGISGWFWLNPGDPPLS